MNIENEYPLAGSIAGSLLFSFLVLGLVGLSRIALTLPSDWFLLVIPAFAVGAAVGWKYPRFFNCIFEILP